mgnify:CR=1 FL=1
MASRGEPGAGPRAGVWTPTLAPPPARGAVLWVLLVAAGAGAALVVVRWAGGRGDAFTNAVVLTVIGWVGVAGVVAGEARRYVLAATPYAAAALALATLATLQAVGDPGDASHTNALVGAYLALPVVYLLFFLLRRPAEALAGAIVTLAAAVALQLALPPAIAGRQTNGGWAGLLTLAWHGLLVLLFYYVPRLRSARDLLEAVIGSSRDAVVLLVPTRDEPSAGSSQGALRAPVSFANEAARRAFGARVGRDLLSEGPLAAATQLRARLAELMRGASETRLNLSLPTTDGPRWFRVTATSFWGGVAVTFADITEHKEDESRALELAHTDLLTGLANRRGFEAEAERRLSAAAEAGEATALCYLDLDGFKAVNDEHGHEVGDGLLKHVAGRLRTAVRATDLVGRIGGDEFVILAAGLDDEASAAFFERVRAAVDAPYSVSGRRLEVSSSLGVVPRVGDLSAALARADAAMYRAKLRGGGVEVAAD